MMGKPKEILHEGFVYREDKLNGQTDVFYCVLKPDTLSFHRRKVHKRHTPLCLLKLDQLTVVCEDRKIEGVEFDHVDSNNNNNGNSVDKAKRFPWKIQAGELKLLLYCANRVDRNSWLAAIEDAKQKLSCLTETATETVSSCDKEDSEQCEKASEQCTRTVSELIAGADGNKRLNRKSVDNSYHSDVELDESVTNDTGDISSAVERKQASRLRSRSLSEVDKPKELAKNEAQRRSVKSKSAPPDGCFGKRGFRTVDKLIDVHSGLCRQLVRWI